MSNSIPIVTFVLGEPRVGYTGYVAGRFFENGFYTQPFADEKAKEGGTKYCSAWNIHPVDSEAGKAIVEEHYGGVQIPEDGAEDPQSDDAASGEQSDGAEATGSQSDDNPEEGPEGSVPSEQDGSAEIEVNERLVTAIKSLDHSNDEHWTANGKPAIAAIEQFYGSSGFTRKDVEDAMPGYVREESE